MNIAWKRLILHIPWGVAGALLCYVGPVFGVIFSVFFLAYEMMQAWRIRDMGYKDVLGFPVGFALMVLLVELL